MKPGCASALRECVAMQQVVVGMSSDKEDISDMVRLVENEVDVESADALNVSVAGKWNS